MTAVDPVPADGHELRPVDLVRSTWQGHVDATRARRARQAAARALELEAAASAGEPVDEQLGLEL